MSLFLALSGWSCDQKPNLELEKERSESVTILENATVDEIQTHIASFKGENPCWSIYGLPGVCLCVEEFPYIMDVKQQYGEKFELVFISADFEEARAEATDFLKEQGLILLPFLNRVKTTIL